MKRFTRFVFLMLGALLLATWTRSPPADASGRPVLAFYYAWFDMNTWSSGQLSDQPAQPYVSADAGTIERHVGQAQAAGIDGFVQSWYGPGGGNQTETNFTTLLNIAAGRGFYAAVDFEAGSPYFGSSADRVAALQYLLATHTNHPAYLRVDGKPVIFFWASWLLSVDEWAAIRAQVDPDHDTIWIVEGSSLDYLPVFDGLHLYNIAWSDNPAGTLGYWGGEVRARAAALGTTKYWAATVMPGWDDTRVAGRSGAFVRDRAGGAYYQACWSGAAASAPDMVIITSFNEWLEGSTIEPSASYGNFYLDLTAQLAAAFKAGSVPAAPAVEAQPTAEPTEAPAGASGEADTPEPVAEISPTPAVTFTPRPSPTPREDGAIIHLVQAGDTLLELAVAYEITLDDLTAWNDLGTDTLLWVGQPLIVGWANLTPAPTDEPPTATATATTPVEEAAGMASSLQEVAATAPLEPGSTPGATEEAVTVISAPTLEQPEVMENDGETPTPNLVAAVDPVPARRNLALPIAGAVVACLLVLGIGLRLRRS